MTGRFPEGLRRRIAAVRAGNPEARFALLPVLHLVQKERGFIGPDDEMEVAGLLGLKPVDVREVVTFYTMFRRRPSGRHLLRVCTNLSCAIRGGGRILDHLRSALGIEPGETTPDGRFTLVEVECLGACDRAPCLMIDEALFSCQTTDEVDDLLGKAQ
jgi:NADH-quinone oxidoreductase subunit E